MIYSCPTLSDTSFNGGTFHGNTANTPAGTAGPNTPLSTSAPAGGDAEQTTPTKPKRRAAPLSRGDSMSFSFSFNMPGGWRKSFGDAAAPPPSAAKPADHTPASHFNPTTNHTNGTPRPKRFPGPPPRGNHTPTAKPLSREQTFSPFTFKTPAPKGTVPPSTANPSTAPAPNPNPIFSHVPPTARPYANPPLIPVDIPAPNPNAGFTSAQEYAARKREARKANAPAFGPQPKEKWMPHHRRKRSESIHEMLNEMPSAKHRRSGSRTGGEEFEGAPQPEPSGSGQPQQAREDQPRAQPLRTDVDGDIHMKTFVQEEPSLQDIHMKTFVPETQATWAQPMDTQPGPSSPKPKPKRRATKLTRSKSSIKRQAEMDRFLREIEEAREVHVKRRCQRSRTRTTRDELAAEKEKKAAEEKAAKLEEQKQEQKRAAFEYAARRKAEAEERERVKQQEQEEAARARAAFEAKQKAWDEQIAAMKRRKEAQEQERLDSQYGQTRSNTKNAWEEQQNRERERKAYEERVRQDRYAHEQRARAAAEQERKRRQAEADAAAAAAAAAAAKEAAHKQWEKELKAQCATSTHHMRNDPEYLQTVLKQYEYLWDELVKPTPTPGSGQFIDVSDFPWPCTTTWTLDLRHVEQIPYAITYESVRDFFFLGAQDKSPNALRRKFKVASMRFHPDKLPRLFPRLMEQDRAFVKAGFERVQIMLNMLMEQCSQ